MAKRLGPVKANLFVTPSCHLLDPLAMAVDVMMIPWIDLHGYTFPPFCLLGRCQQKTASQQTTVVLVGLHQPWYPGLLNALVEIPILISHSPSLLSGKAHSSNYANMLTHSPARRQEGLQESNNSVIAFQNGLLASSWPAGARIRTQPTNQPDGREGS